MCIEAFLERFPNGRVVVIVPTLALLDQWFVDITDSTDFEDSDVASYSGEQRPEQAAKINLAVLNTARDAMPLLAASTTEPMMLVVDECHRAGSPENARALEGDYEAVLGLSATPEREDEGFEERIEPVLGPIIYRYGYSQASADRVIVDFNLVNVEIAPDPEKLLTATNATEKFRHLLQSEWAKSKPREAEQLVQERALRAARSALRVPWAVKLALLHRDERIILFHERVDSLQNIADLLRKNGQNSVAYHSKLSDAHRRDNLRLFRRGVISTLVTCRALDEGANVPEANVAVVAKSTSSTRQRIQRLGRVLRPAKGKKEATIYTLFAGDEEREYLADEERSLEGVAHVLWKRGSFSATRASAS